VNETAIQLRWKEPAYDDVSHVTGYTVVYTGFVSTASSLTRLSLDDPTISSVVRYAVLPDAQVFSDHSFRLKN